MANAIAKTHAPLGAVTILHVVDAIISVFNSVVEWNNARKTRKILSQLTDAQLEDIGLKRATVETI